MAKKPTHAVEPIDDAAFGASSVRVPGHTSPVLPAAPATEQKGPGRPRKLEGERANITLTVSEDMRWEYKQWCAKHRISQVDAFHKAFELLKREMGE